MNDDKDCFVMDDLVPDEPIPDSAWTDKIPDGVLHGSIRMSASKYFFRIKKDDYECSSNEP